MMQDISFALVQPNTVWEDKDANFQRIEGLLKNVQPVDVIVLPETFPTGFSHQPETLAEPMNGQSLQWMQDMAARYKCLLTGSLMAEDRGYYNRLVAVHENGLLGYYDKKHLFRPSGENEKFTPGSKKWVFEWKGWKICPMICYDLRFPVWIRNRQEYDVLLFVANWPAQRQHVWEVLLKARAIENSCYCLGINRVGQDGKGVVYQGGSMGIDFKGDIMARAAASEEIVYLSLDACALQEYREKFPVHLDTDYMPPSSPKPSLPPSP